MAIYPSQYSFTQPVRYYKHNDPYYYEVDNLPIRQLEENILWLKDQYSAFLGTGATGTELGFLRAGDDIDLEWIKQFRPKWVDGRTIKVQSGRYIGRVNDARGKDDSNLADSYSSTPWNSNNWIILGLGSQRSETLLDDIYTNFTTSLSNSVSTLGANNGLETMFTFYIQTPIGGSLGEAVDVGAGRTYLPQYAAQSIAGPFGGNIGAIDGIPNTRSMPVLWHGSFPVYAGDNGTVDFSLDNWANLPRRHLELVRKWKGVYRTAVMDYIEESIEIPEFSDSDFTGGAAAGATQRLDLLVVYGHPIDASSSDLIDGTSTSNQAPLTITNPKLGLIKGAGIGIGAGQSISESGGSYATNSLLEPLSQPGNSKILANPNAERGDSNTGMTLADGTVVNGSFPSPDDLGNIAASIAYDIEGDGAIQLVGQCVLPICYVIVESGVSTLSQDRIIDIRPFLRSAELTYNERAGVAAANPPLSMGNPAVGQAQLKYVYNKIKSELGTTNQTTFTVGSNNAPIPFIKPGNAWDDNGTTQYYGLPESGYPNGTGSRATDGCRLNDAINLQTTLVATGYGIVNYYANNESTDGSDADGFSKYVTSNGSTSLVNNPLFDSTNLHTNTTLYSRNEGVKFNLGCPMLNIDISNYQQATVEETEASIQNDFYVVAKAYVAGGEGDGSEDFAGTVRARGWSVVERTVNGVPTHYLTVRADLWMDDPDTPFMGFSADILLTRKVLST